MLNSKFAALKASIRAAGADTKSFKDVLTNVVKSAAGIFNVSSAFSIIRKGFSEIISNVKELDSAMVEFKKVTNLSEAGYDKFLKSTAKTSREIGTNLIDMVSGTADFVKLGYTADQAAELAKSSNILYKVGDGFNNISEATDAVIASMKAYGLSVNDVVSITDKLNKVSNETSIDTAGLAEALTRSASALNVGGLDLDRSLALIVAGNEATRDAAATGTALKTLSARIRGAKTELAQLGEEEDSYVNSTSKLRQSILDLTGVDIMADAAKGQYKDLFEILKEISGVYEDLTDIDRANVMEILFGKRNVNVGASIVQNFDQAEKALKAAQNSTGSALSEHERWMQSIEASEAQAEASFQQFSNSVMNSDLLKFYYDTKSGILGFLTELIDKFGSISTLAPIATTLFGAYTGKNLLGYSDNGGQGFLNKLTFLGKPINQGQVDTDIIKAYNEGIAKELSPEDSLNLALGATKKLNNATGQLIKDANGAAVSQEALAVATSNFGKQSTIAAAGSKLLSTALSAIASIGFAVAINFAIKAIDSIVTTQDELNDASAEAKSSLEDATSNVESLNSQLEETQKLLNQMEGRELTIVEQNEYDRLKKQNDELERSIKLEQIRVKTLEKDARSAATAAMNEYDNAYRVLESDQDDLLDGQVTLGSKTRDFLKTYANVTGRSGEEMFRMARQNPNDFVYDPSMQLGGGGVSYYAYSPTRGKAVEMAMEVLPELQNRRFNAQREYDQWFDLQSAIPGWDADSDKRLADLKSAKDQAESDFDMAYKIVNEYWEYTNGQIGNLSRIENPVTAADRKWNAQFDLNAEIGNFLIGFDDAEYRQQVNYVKTEYEKESKELANFIIKMVRLPPIKFKKISQISGKHLRSWDGI